MQRRWAAGGGRQAAEGGDAIEGQRGDEIVSARPRPSRRSGSLCFVYTISKTDRPLSDRNKTEDVATKTLSTN